MSGKDVRVVAMLADIGINVGYVVLVGPLFIISEPYLKIGIIIFLDFRICCRG